MTPGRQSNQPLAFCCGLALRHQVPFDASEDDLCCQCTRKQPHQPADNLQALVAEDSLDAVRQVNTTPTVKLARAMLRMAVSLSSQWGWLPPITSKAPMVPGPTVSGNAVSGTMVTSCYVIVGSGPPLPWAVPLPR